MKMHLLYAFWGAGGALVRLETVFSTTASWLICYNDFIPVETSQSQLISVSCNFESSLLLHFSLDVHDSLPIPPTFLLILARMFKKSRQTKIWKLRNLLNRENMSEAARSNVTFKGCWKKCISFRNSSPKAEICLCSARR